MCAGTARTASKQEIPDELTDVLDRAERFAQAFAFVARQRLHLDAVAWLPAVSNVSDLLIQHQRQKQIKGLLEAAEIDRMAELACVEGGKAGERRSLDDVMPDRQAPWRP